jgi:hypothetical protein
MPTPKDPSDSAQVRGGETSVHPPGGSGTPRLFRPSAASLNWVISIGFVSLGYAMYLRYLVIEQSAIGIACDTGLKTWLCFSRGIVSAMFNNEVFGWVSVGAAVLTLIRPSVPLFTIALASSAFGLVLHNGTLSGLAAALLVMSFARPVIATE